MYVLYKNQFICKKAEDGTLIPCLALSEDLTQTIAEAPVITADVASDKIPVQDFAIGGYELLWIFDKDNHNAANIKSNNLLLVSRDADTMQLIWNMKEAVAQEDASVLVSLVDDQTFSFTTFNGKCFTMKVAGGAVTLMDSRITK